MKVLIVGLGSIARKHINALKRIEKSVEIFALRSSNLSPKVDDIIDIYDLNEVYRHNFDFVILSNPTGLHYEYLKQLKGLKLPLFIEKPLFDKVDNKKKILVANILKDNIPTYVACNLRFLDCINKIKDLIKTERVNEVNVYCGSYLPDWRPNVDFRKVYSANIDMGGGVHIDLIHELDYIFWLFGEPIYTRSTFTNQSSLNISSYDYANYLWLYEKSAVNIVLNYYRRDPKRCLEIICDSGTFYVDLLQNNISFNDKVIYESKQQMSETYYTQMRFFIEKVIHKNDKFNSIDQAYKILELCLKD